ncbi:PKD domain-containing protein [Flavobacterium aestivum]|uniref:PKD domain-containing protein n=1 Tax=Flavobacterium aestivum TaxID=3003257 RepID=UPI0024830849|nr:PKD domain-containing protein [Flavobacterium aestivum]
MKHSLFLKKLYDIKFSLSLFFVIGLGILKVDAQAPPSFTYEVYKSGFDQAVGSVFDAQNNLYVWEKSGRIWRIAPNQERTGSTPLIDLSDEVYNLDDHGLLGFALDPQFASNGYVYLWYSVERSVLYNEPGIPKDSAGATQGRCTRYTVINGVADLNSRKVLLGAVKGDGPPIMGITHGVGSCFFGNDGSLMLTVGDGSLGDAYGPEGISRGVITQEMSNLLQLRSQNINSFSGKILRLNKETGEGIPSNPYYDASIPKSPKSIMYASGLRNPYRATCIPNTALGANHPGFVLISDTGENTWEEVALYTNFADNGGWPYYEGFDRGRVNGQIAYPLPVPAVNFRSPLYSWPHPFNPVENGNVGKIRVNGQPVLVTALNNSPNYEGTSSTGNTFYPDGIINDRYNNLLDNAVLVADYTQDKVRAILYNGVNGVVDFENPKGIIGAGTRGGVVSLQTNPYDGYIYAVDYTGSICRLKLAGNAVPVANIRTSSPTSSATNSISVQLYSDQSYDADDVQLSYFWDFGDGQTSTLINPAHTFTTGGNAPEYRTVTLTVRDPHNNVGTTTLRVNLNNLPPVIPAIIIKDSNNNEVNSIGIGTGYPRFLNVTFDTNAYDDHDAATDLTYEWSLNRHHNSHVHAGSKITTKSGTFLLEPEGGCGEGATYWFQVVVKITDRNGAVSTLQKNIYQRCTDLLQQTITVPPVANKYLSETSFALNGTSTSGLPVDYFRVSGPVTINSLTGIVTLTGIPGPVEIVAVQAGNAQYGNAYPVSIKFDVIGQPKIISTTEGSRCGAGPVTLSATATSGTLAWYNVETGGSPIATGNSFTTNITQTTTYYVVATDNGVPSARVPVLAKIAGKSLPFTEDFQGNGLPEGWTVLNTNDPSKTWLQRNYGRGNEATKKSFAYYNYYGSPDFVNNQVVEQDELRTPGIDLSRANAALLNFDLAYAYNNADDGLTVLVSTDCGYTFTKTSYEVKGINLATAGNNNSSFYPNYDNEWRQCSVDLTAYIGNPNVIVAFRNTPAYGNNIYIDNVKVTNEVMAPVASFTSPNKICVGQSTTFNNTSVGGGTLTYSWTFRGDQGAVPSITTSTLKNPSVTYGGIGWAMTTLTVSNSRGTSQVFTSPWIYVDQCPVDTQKPSTPVLSKTGIALNWTASTDNVQVTGYDIFKDNVLLASINGTSYTPTGLVNGITYRFKVRAKDAANNLSDFSNEVDVTFSNEVETAPVANFTSPAEICSGQSATFTDSSTGGNLTYLWTFRGDQGAVPNITTSALKNPSITCSGTGWVLVSLSVTNSKGNNLKYSNWIQLKTCADTQKPSTPVLSKTGTTLNWTASTDNVQVTGYDIFRDNVLLASINDITYTPTGLVNGTTYRFKVRAKDAANNLSDFSNEIDITASEVETVPVANFTSPADICSGQSVTFTDSSTGGNLTYLWAFRGDQGAVPNITTSALRNPSITCSGTGWVLVSLSVTNSKGNNLKYSNWIQLKTCSNGGGQQGSVVPVASFTIPSRICIGQSAVFANTSTVDNANTYLWTFIGPNSETLATQTTRDANYVFPFNNGTWVKIKLKVTNSVGSSEKESEWILTQNCTTAKLVSQKSVVEVNNIKVDDVIETNDIVLSPNPNKGLLNISSTQSDITKVNIFDAVGKLVFETANENKGRATQLDLAHLTDGVYVVIVNTTDKSFSKKIVIKK